ncbi:MAG TPA: thiol-activated cytolysin family protein [Gemmatimonadales bacterium]|nr:thiol-activated cytolysin family protein [Gemmatimonadales bacterium]
MRYLGQSVLLVAALVAGCNNDPSPTVTQDAPNITRLIDSSGKFAEGPVMTDSTVTGTDTANTARIDSINNLITDTTWVEQTIHVSAADNPDQFMMFDPNASTLWPGNLIQGQSIASGVPQAVPVSDRAPATVFLAIVSGDSAGSANKIFRTVNDPSGSTVTQAMNDILAGYHGGTPAKYNFSMEQAYSASQINFTLGFGYTGPAANTTGSFGFAMSSAKSRYVVRLTQQYFTMAMDDPQGAAGVFGPSVTAQTLAPYVGNGNPLCYISSVTYGRVFYLIYESQASALQLQQALNFAYNGGVASGSVTDTFSFNQVMSQTQVSLFQLGGDPGAGLVLSDPKNFDSINSFLTKGADFTPNNVGAPISYTIKYLQDASLVRMNSTMEYDYTARTPIASGVTATKSSFVIAMPDVYIPNSTDPNGGDGGVWMRVGIHDDATNTDSIVYSAPSSNSDGSYGGTPGGIFWDFGQDAMKTGTTFQVNWSSPSFTVSDTAGHHVWMDVFGNEYDDKRYWASRRIQLDYDPVSRSWKISNNQYNLMSTTLTGVGSDTDIQFDYSFTRNGVKLQ